jgi:membrane protease YdiL (CAAX protease family)
MNNIQIKSNRALLTGLRWQPNRDTLVALGSYLLVVSGLYLAFQVITTDHVAANFILFGPVIMALLGVALPVLYTALVRRRPLSDLGLTFENFVPNLILSILLGWDTYQNTIATLDVAWNRNMVALVTMVIAVGLFETIFFRGWLQLRFEEAFGLVPGLLLGALCYGLYHIGYGMERGELVFLFFLGLQFGAFFRLTKSFVVLWPFYTPMGSLYTNLIEGRAEILPFEATYGFLLTLGLMAASIVTAIVLSHKEHEEELPRELATKHA